jgi:PAS domain S-box-containing protein
MPNDADGVLATIDLGLLGRSMLGAAEAAHIGVTLTVLDPVSPRNVYASAAAADILGFSVEELLARNPLDFIAPRDMARIRDRLDRRARGEEGQASYEVSVVRKDGTEAFIEVTASRTTYDGRPAVFAFLVDVGAKREAERQLGRNEARFRELIEVAPEPISIIRDGHFAYVNRAYVDVLGYPDAAALYRVPVGSLVDDEQRSVQAARESLLLGGGTDVPPYLYRVRRFDGTSLVLEVRSVYFEYEGKPAILGMARDVTERKRLEHQLIQSDRMAALGTMAAGVAHEINNPLAYVILNLEWISRKLPDAGRDPESLAGLMAMLDEARHGAERVSTIVRELRSFSRVDGETRRSVDLAAVVRSATKLVGHEIRHRARLTLSFEPTRPVWASHARLEQVVINLLLNASQAMPDDRPDGNEIRISIREDGERRAVLEVFDNGVGIAPDVLPRIFDPFFTTKPASGGTGLGLSICHGIVTSLGGQISACGVPGEGTTFRVVLPTSEPIVDELRLPPVESSPRRAQPGARVLVVDDEAPIATTLRDLLAPEHEVVAATTAREALEAIAQDDFDVVFCDLMMPGGSGIDLYEQVRVDHPGLERRIVFMTGGAFTPRALEFLASVENQRVEKPFSLSHVEQIVRDMAKERAAPRGSNGATCS